MSKWDAEVLGDLPQEVVNTITSARAPSMRQAYALKWNLFVGYVPRPGYVPRVPTSPFGDQVVSLRALPPKEADPALALLVPSEH